MTIDATTVLVRIQTRLADNRSRLVELDREEERIAAERTRIGAELTMLALLIDPPEPVAEVPVVAPESAPRPPLVTTPEDVRLRGPKPWPTAMEAIVAIVAKYPNLTPPQLRAHYEAESGYSGAGAAIYAVCGSAHKKGLIDRDRDTPSKAYRYFPRVVETKPLPRRSVDVDPEEAVANLRMRWNRETQDQVVGIVKTLTGKTAREMAPTIMRETGLSADGAVTIVSVLATQGRVERRRFADEKGRPFRYYPLGKAPKSDGIGLESLMVSGLPR